MLNPVSQPLGRVSTTEAIVESIKSQILDGTLPPGTRLREIELAEAHGVSRQSMRSALAVLSGFGLTTQLPHKGVWVRDLSADDIEDLYKVRFLIEAEAVRFVTTNPATWVRLQAGIDRLERLSPSAAWSEVVEADWSFHHEAVRCVDSRRLGRAHGLLEYETTLSFRRVPAEDDAGTVAEVHRRLLAEIRTGDVDRAVAALWDHLETSKQQVLALQ
jgi:DNA-binding GntR family transcriptional regulator